MSNDIDQSIFFVECDFGKIGKAFVEIDRDSNSRKQVIENIASGEYRDVVTVLECNPVEGFCKEVTAEIMEEVELRVSPAKWVDRHVAAFDHARDYHKHEVA